jgi:hypothetical protein
VLENDQLEDQKRDRTNFGAGTVLNQPMTDNALGTDWVPRQVTVTRSAVRNGSRATPLQRSSDSQRQMGQRSFNTRVQLS